MIGYSTFNQTSRTREDSTLTPELIVQSYESAYRKVHGRDVRVRHIGGQWYYVGGETVHRITLMAEIMRLREQTRQEPSYAKPNRTIIQRLITRLRAM